MVIKETKKPVVMIIDDTPANLEVLEEMLTRQGYDVVAFPRGDMALRAATGEPPDLILLDIMMPVMDGFEVCRQLKSNQYLSAIPVIFISALADTENKVKAFSNGGVDYVTKPFHEEEVVSRISVHLELKRQKEEIQKLLSETLVGAVKSLNELLAIAAPESYRETLKITQHVRTFCQRAKIENGWMFEVASNFLNLGSLVDEDARKLAFQLKAKPIDLQEDVLKEVANIVRCIPRLDIIASMIEKATVFPNTSVHWRNWPVDVLGGHLLYIVIIFERYLEKGFSKTQALQSMMEPTSMPLFDQRLLEDFGKTVFNTYSVLEKETPQQAAIEELNVEMVKVEGFDINVGELQPNQVLVEDLMTQTGIVMVSRGTVLTQNLCIQIQNKHKIVPLIFPVRVKWAATEDM